MINYHYHGVVLVVIRVRDKVPTLHSMMGEGVLVTWPLKNKDFGSKWGKQGLVKVEGSIEEIFGR